MFALRALFPTAQPHVEPPRVSFHPFKPLFPLPPSQGSFYPPASHSDVLQPRSRDTFLKLHFGADSRCGTSQIGTVVQMGVHVGRGGGIQCPLIPHRPHPGAELCLGFGCPIPTRFPGKGETGSSRVAQENKSQPTPLGNWKATEPVHPGCVHHPASPLN